MSVVRLPGLPFETEPKFQEHTAQRTVPASVIIANRNSTAEITVIGAYPGL